jgi:hypothetical protein
MAHERYFIVFEQGHWRIKHNDQLSEPYSSEASAVGAAIDAAYHAGSYGDEAQVLVRGDDRLFIAVWIFGLDVYPPSQKFFDLFARHRSNQRVHEEAVTLAGASVQCPCHVCGLFNGAEEQYAVLLPFVQEGWLRGERSLLLLDQSERNDRLSRLKKSGIDVEAALRTGQLQIEVWENCYLRDGRFDPASMLEFLNDVLIAGSQHGFARTRVWANMEWALSDAPGVEALADYESQFNRLLPQYEDAVVCAYDVERFPAVILEGVVRAHPYLLADGWGRENRRYVPPT